MSVRAMTLSGLRGLYPSWFGAALVALTLTACGTGAALPSQPPASQPPASPLEAPANATLAVSATEYAFDGPDAIQAGKVLLTLTNNGEYSHHAQLWRLKDGISIEDYKGILAKESHTATIGAIASLAGGVGAVGRGGSAQAVVDLTPGTYFLVCVVLSPTQHLYRGMFRGLTVTEPKTATTVWSPATEATVTFSGGGFQLPADIVAGHHVWTFENDGPGPRSFEVRSAEGDGYYGGGAVIDQGAHETVVLDLGAGDYLAMSTWIETGTRTTTNFTVR